MLEVGQNQIKSSKTTELYDLIKFNDSQSVGIVVS